MKRPVERLAAGRLARIAARYELSDAQVEQLWAFLDLLAGDPRAPTAVRDPVAALDVHLSDSLAGLVPVDAALAREAAVTIADIGSGAGLPGIPLAVARPQAAFELVEATHRKCAFLDDTVAALGLGNARVRCARAEEVPAMGLRESYGLVTARAVAPLATLVEYASPLLAQSGELVAWKGRRMAGEEEGGRRAAVRVGMEPVEARAVTPYEGSRNRHLYLYRKVRPCPPEFPRRPGRARRNPLG